VAKSTGNNNGARPSLGRAFLSRLMEAKVPGASGHITFWSIAIVGVVLDLWTKSVAFKWLEEQPEQRYAVIDGFLNLVMALNNGAAFNLFAGHPVWLAGVSVVALATIVVIFVLSGGQHKLMPVALGFFAGGVCGNLYDRLFNDGLVRDFIDVVYWPGRHWPAFNVADSMLCIAVGLLIISSLLSPKSSQTRAQQHR
jgi:signal peptidase II